ncbi:TPA: hypothetical protein NJY08_004842 [Salmonella enterica subsp. enterica serovar Typhi str. AG3]|nr:hypothetical protein [Salmonella enterica subsp. enterica serovar Typhi str. AG3]
MTKLVITIDEKQVPIVERYEKDLQVGIKKITHEKLYRSVIEDSSIDMIFDILVNLRFEDVKSYLDNQENDELSEEGYDFILLMFTHIKDGIISSDMFSEYAEIVMEKVDKDDIPLEQFTKLLSVWVERLGKTPSKLEYLELYKSILQYFLGANGEEDILIQKELLNTIYRYVNSLKEKEKINRWVTNHLIHLPASTLIEAVREKSSEGKPILYGFSSVPKNASNIIQTSTGTIYLYDIPKTKLRVKYHDVAFEEVGHPRLLFAVITNKKNEVEMLKACALKGKTALELSTPIFKYPYSNVYSDGKVCWGGYHSLPIDQIPLMFLSTPNNSHLNGETLDLFKKYEGKVFSDRILQHTNLSLEEWLIQ